jgi:hypothetical protein
VSKCSIEGCEKPLRCKALCDMHYIRMRKHGNPHTLKVKQLHGLSMTERFWAYVQKTASCWVWTGTQSDNGYGRIWGKGRHIKAHRFSWELHNGPIPEGMHVCHKCDTPACVNPEHLFLGTASDNMRDMVAKGRHSWGENRPGASHAN